MGDSSGLVTLTLQVKVNKTLQMFPNNECHKIEICFLYYIINSSYNQNFNFEQANRLQVFKSCHI